jgi:hypothetical protein
MYEIRLRTCPERFVGILITFFTIDGGMAVSRKTPYARNVALSTGIAGVKSNTPERLGIARKL